MQSHDLIDREWLSIPEAATLVERLTNTPRTEHTIRSWHSRGLAGRKLPAVRLGKRLYVNPTDLIEFLRGRAVTAPRITSTPAEDVLSLLLGRPYGVKGGAR